MNQAENSDSITHAEKSNPTSRTDFSSKTLWDIFLGHPVFVIGKHLFVIVIVIVIHFVFQRLYQSVIMCLNITKSRTPSFILWLYFL